MENDQYLTDIATREIIDVTGEERPSIVTDCFSEWLDRHNIPTAQQDLFHWRRIACYYKRETDLNCAAYPLAQDAVRDSFSSYIVDPDTPRCSVLREDKKKIMDALNVYIPASGSSGSLVAEVHNALILQSCAEDWIKDLMHRPEELVLYSDATHQCDGE